MGGWKQSEILIKIKIGYYECMGTIFSCKWRSLKMLYNDERINIKISSKLSKPFYIRHYTNVMSRCGLLRPQASTKSQTTSFQTAHCPNQKGGFDYSPFF